MGGQQSKSADPSPTGEPHVAGGQAAGGADKPRMPCKNEQEEAFSAARHLPASANAKNKQAALDACADQHADLLQCFLDKRSFLDCADLQKKFWECYTRERGFNKTRFAAWFNGHAPRGEASEAKEGNTRT